MHKPDYFSLPTATGPLTPEMQLICEKIRAGVATAPDLISLPVEDIRVSIEKSSIYWNQFDEDGLRISSLSIPVDSGAIIRGVRVTPQESYGTLLYVHGGGWAFNSTATHRVIMAQLAKTCSVDVIGIDYRLAPEYKHPTALEDTLAAWRWMLASAQALGLRGPLYIAGDSVGAALAVAACVRLRYNGDTVPDAALLFYGVYSPDEPGTNHELYGQGPHIVSQQKMDWFRGLNEPEASRARQTAEFSPLRGDLSGLPDLYVTAAEHDSLRESSLLLANAAVRQGVHVEFKLEPGVIHGFMQMARDLPAARQAFEDAAAFLYRRAARDSRN